MRLDLHGSKPRWADPATDALLEGYVAWREASSELAAAHRRWAQSDPHDAGLAGAGYLAALDREQKAAGVYEELVRDLSRLLKQ
ncbi:MAG TPA: hypothetical protein VMD09_13500 [Solirubrobacteraceae bacterium]|nr:hypothetical protein [Solirubrobacteraceae bacterium]